MPSWTNCESPDDDEYMSEFSSMQMEYFTLVYVVWLLNLSLSACYTRRGQANLLHLKAVTFGRRFIGCSLEVRWRLVYNFIYVLLNLHDGVNCGVVPWVDAPWPPILQRCLIKLWDMYHEQNLGRVRDNEAHEKEVAKLKKELDSLGNHYTQLVNDVSNLFDYQDGMKSHSMDYTSQENNELKEKKRQLEEHTKIELQMEKLKLKKEQRCILQTRADIIQNTRKAMNELEVDRDLIKEEKGKLEHVIAELLKAGHGCKEKLDKIKEVVMEE
ncbi:hypothetical protein ZWY2020_018330 [Hordeum vulgare]|nr:hypothetical protein ZWY2020_018330 [Hordeum vulgare]